MREDDGDKEDRGVVESDATGSSCELITTFG